MTSSRDRDSFATLLSRAASPAAHALIADVSEAIVGWEQCREVAKEVKGASRGKYKRGAQREKAFRDVLERFVGGLLRAHHDKLKTEDASGQVFRSLSKQAYRRGAVVSYRNLTAAIDGLEGSGLITHTKGQGRFVAFGQLLGKASRFKATSKLLKFASDVGVVVADIDEHFHLELPPRTLELRESSRWVFGRKIEGARIEYQSTPQTKQLADDVKKINAFLAGFKLGGGVHYGFVRRFNEGERRDFKWDRGGRLYSGTVTSYQQLNGADRARMTIDGEPVVEIDVGASYLTAFHAQLGEALDLTSDPYDRIGLPRDLVKAWTTISFGQGKPIARWPRSYLLDGKIRPARVCSARKVRDAMLAAYPALSRLEDPRGHWAVLMFVESEAIITTMQHLMLQGIPSFPVHDSLIVPVSKAALVAQILPTHYQFHVGVRPRLDTKCALPGVREAVQHGLAVAPPVRPLLQQRSKRALGGP